MSTVATTSRPTAEQTLLLKAALRTDEVGRDAWASWSRSVEPDNIDSASQRIIPLLLHNLKRLGVEPHDPGWMKKLHRYWWIKNQLRLRRLGDVVRILAPTPVMVLKGLPLALRYYDDVGLRPMSDLDVLVPTADAGKSLERLLGNGWTIKEQWPDLYRADGSLDTSAHPGIGLVDAEGQECDLHWHIFHDCCWDGADDVFWEAAEPLLCGGTTVLALSPTDLLFHVCIHGAAYNAVPTMRWVADAVVILETAGDRVDWDRLVELSRCRLLLLPMKQALGYLEDEMAIGIPAEVRRRLDRARVSVAERREYAMRIRDPDYLYTFVGRWCQLSRRYDQHGFWGKLGRIPGFMKEIWSVERTRQLPAVISRRILPAYLRKIKAS